MVLLKFDTVSIHYDEKTKNRECIKNIISKEYDESKTLLDVLHDIYLEYEKYNGKYNNEWEKHCDIFNINKLFWGKYFSDEIVNQMPYTFSDYKKMTIGDLDHQFEICNMVIPVFINKEKGGVVGKYEGIDFFFHMDEKDKHKNNPHIHCKYSGCEICVYLNTMKVVGKPFNKSKMQLALEIIKNNKEDLLNYWKKVVINGETIKFKMKF